MSQKRKNIVDHFMRSKNLKGSYSNTKLSPSLWYGWKELPDRIFGDILMMVGLNSLEELQKCRQFCQCWNTMTSKMTKRKKVSIRRKAESLAAQIREESEAYDFRALPDILSAAILAHHGILGSVENIVLKNIDLEAVPIKHMALLVSCVIDYVEIDNVKNCDLTPILDNTKCEYLDICNQSLESEETQALVRAMDSHVKRIALEVHLDMMVLTQYAGEGKCENVNLGKKTRKRYRKKMRRWVMKINWVPCCPCLAIFYRPY